MRTGRTRGRAAGRLIAALGCTLAIIVPPATTAASVRAAVPAPYVEQGYWVVTTDGSVFNYGSALNFGGGSGPGKAVWLTATPSGMGYWIPTFGGVVHVFGDAPFLGDAGKLRLNAGIQSMASTSASGTGWSGATAASSTTDRPVLRVHRIEEAQQAIVGLAPTADGAGYWLVGSDGGIFSFGTRASSGRPAPPSSNKPIVGMVPTHSGQGYWLVASDGGVFAFGDAGFVGSAASIALNKPIVGLDSTPTGLGYWMAASDGGVFNFGDATFQGSLGGQGRADIVHIGAKP